MRSTTIALAGSLVAMLLAGCGAGSDRRAEVPETVASSPPAADRALDAGRWRVEVSVRPARLGPIAVAVTDPEMAKATSSDPWVEHDLVFRNSGDRPVAFADTRSSAFTGEGGHHRLLVADEGCGYAQHNPGAPAKAGTCRLYLDMLAVEPGDVARRSITLFKDLPGMDRLTAGTYVFDRPVRFKLGKRAPSEGEGRSDVMRVVYEVAAQSG